MLYSKIKNSFVYERYLNYTAVALTRIRLSNHRLSVERGSYKRPLTPPENRICTLCSDDVGDDLHCMLLICSFNKIH